VKDRVRPESFFLWFCDPGRLAQCDKGCGGGWLNATRAAVEAGSLRQGLLGCWLNTSCVKGCGEVG
jgi:hypothetical protein